MFVVPKQNSERKGNAMNDFIAKYEEQLSGTLSGFDRLVFSGNVWKDRLTGMKGYLWAHGLAAKDFGEPCRADQQTGERSILGRRVGGQSPSALSELRQRR